MNIDRKGSGLEPVVGVARIIGVVPRRLGIEPVVQGDGKVVQLMQTQEVAPGLSDQSDQAGDLNNPGDVDNVRVHTSFIG
jgi:hypothetical protein